jgi:hypothetical protein
MADLGRGVFPVADSLNQHAVKILADIYVFFVPGGIAIGQIVGDSIGTDHFNHHAAGGSIDAPVQTNALLSPVSFMARGYQALNFVWYGTVYILLQNIFFSNCYLPGRPNRLRRAAGYALTFLMSAPIFCSFSTSFS